MNVMNRLDVTLERAQDGFALALDKRPRGRKAVALNFDAEIEHIVDFDQTLLTRARQLGRSEHGGIDATGFDRAQAVARRAGDHQGTRPCWAPD